MASGGLLSLKWNNHKSTFFHVLSTIRSKEAYCDATIACDGRFYPVHKLIMSTCSDYFEEMFARANCKHPVIVLKDIRHEDLEALLNYMYVGEVNVLQNELAGLIKAAECLQIKGLAVPDEAPSKDSPNESKRRVPKEESPQAKRKRRDDGDSGRYDSGNNSSRSSSQNQLHRESSFSSSQPPQPARRPSNASGQSSSFRRRDSSPHHTSDSLPDDLRPIQNSSQNDNYQTNNENSRMQDMPSSQTHKPVSEVLLDEPIGVKEEPEEIEEIEEIGEVQEDTKNILESSFSYEQMSEGDFLSNISESGSQGAQGFDAQMLPGAPQSMEDIVAQAMPGSSGMQENSIWESEGSLQGFPAEAFGTSQRAPQMVLNHPDSRSAYDDAANRTLKAPNPKERKFTCPHCPYNTYHKGNLEKHIRVHTGEKPFSCPYCTLSFAQVSSLDQHKRTHTGEKPFQCYLCPYASAQKSNLMKHVKTHQGGS